MVIRWQVPLVIVFFSTLSVVLGGYVSFSSDQLLYVPYFLHGLGATFSPFDQVISFNQGAWSIFGDLFELILRVPQPYVFWVIFSVFFLARVLYFYALYRLAVFFAKDSRIGLWVPVVFIGGMLVYGTVASTLDNELIPRALALPVSLLGLSFLVHSKRLVASLCITLAFCTHPLTGLVFFAAYYLDALAQLWRRQFVTVDIFAWLIPIVGVFGLTLIKSLPPGGALFIDPIWQTILTQRDTFIYLTAWPGYASTLLCALPLDFCALLYLRNKLFEPRSIQGYWFNLLLVAPLLAIGVSLVGVDWLQIHPLAQLQVLRTLIFWKVLLALGFGIYALKHNHEVWLRSFFVFATALSLIVSQTAAFVFIPALLALEYLPTKWGRFFSVAVCVVAVAGLETLSFLQIKTEPHLGLSVVVVLVVGIIATMLRSQGIILVRWGSALVGIGLVVCAGLLFVNKSFVLPPWSQDRDFMDACNWLQEHTAKSDVILTEPYSDVPYLRIACSRSIYTSEKDGAMGLFSRDYALEWKHRQDMVNQIYRDPAKARSLAGMQVRYVFAQNYANLPYVKVFDSGPYSIYSIH